MSIKLRILAATVAGLLLTGGCAAPTTEPVTPGVPTSSPIAASPTAASPTATEAAQLTPTAVATTGVPTPAAAPLAPAAPAAGGNDNGSGSCHSDEYRNSNGDCVPRPTHAAAAPAGATAECNDGTYSFSKHHSGTCSHHGGVKRWL